MNAVNAVVIKMGAICRYNNTGFHSLVYENVFQKVVFLNLHYCTVRLHVHYFYFLLLLLGRVFVMWIRSSFWT